MEPNGECLDCTTHQQKHSKDSKYPSYLGGSTNFISISHHIHQPQLCKSHFTVEDIKVIKPGPRGSVFVGGCVYFSIPIFHGPQHLSCIKSHFTEEVVKNERGLCTPTARLRFTISQMSTSKELIKSTKKIYSEKILRRVGCTPPFQTNSCFGCQSNVQSLRQITTLTWTRRSWVTGAQRMVSCFVWDIFHF